MQAMVDHLKVQLVKLRSKNRELAHLNQNVSHFDCQNRSIHFDRTNRNCFLKNQMAKYLDLVDEERLHEQNLLLSPVFVAFSVVCGIENVFRLFLSFEDLRGISRIFKLITCSSNIFQNKQMFRI